MRQLIAVGKVNRNGEIEVDTGKSLVCSNCGDTEDVITRVCRIHDGHDVEVAECWDRGACWTRWDKQFGVTCIDDDKEGG